MRKTPAADSTPSATPASSARHRFAGERTAASRSAPRQENAGSGTRRPPTTNKTSSKPVHTASQSSLVSSDGQLRVPAPSAPSTASGVATALSFIPALLAAGPCRVPAGASSSGNQGALHPIAVDATLVLRCAGHEGDLVAAQLALGDRGLTATGPQGPGNRLELLLERQAGLPRLPRSLHLRR